ncbi:hypothetical protein P7C71_g1394, partial [Lecanoromycetidae sp. Uapishka_2]
MLKSCSIYATLPFKFIIDGDPFYIHAALVSLHSKPLDRLINGHMLEAQKGFAVLEDVTADTFVRFTQWAYQGYYEAAHSRVACASSSSSASGEQVEGELDAVEALEPVPERETAEDNELSWGHSLQHTDWGRHRKSLHKIKKPKEKREDSSPLPRTTQIIKQELKEAFIRREPTYRQETIRIPPPLPNEKPEEDYTDVFLSHARVYVFADKYDIQPLKHLALEELHATLAIFELYPERTGDIIALLRYVYANTGEPVVHETESEVCESQPVGGKDLRSMLTNYVGYQMDTLMKDPDFKDLMIEDGGALLADFIRMVQTRLWFYASPPFKFIVQGNSIYVHAELVSYHSKPLDRMMNIKMAENNQGFAVLEEVDTGTFACFVEWAYNGYYTAPGPVIEDLYDIQPLKVLALEELQATLGIFDLYTQRTTDIVSLLRYVYGQKNASAEGEDIRTMLNQYIGYEMDILIKDESFRDLMIEDGGALLDDVLGMVGKRIC